MSGTELLGRDITLSTIEDLGALDALKLGIEQVVPERDHVDRPVVVVMPTKDWSLYKDIRKVRSKQICDSRINTNTNLSYFG